MLKDGILIALFIVLLIGGPIVSIWSVNTLFEQVSIPYTFKTWFASAWFFGLVLSGRGGK